MTRQALLDAAGALLDAGGPDAVTLREVGARTGVSRSAPYRHFENKDTLLTALATNAMTQLGDRLESIAAEADSPEQSLRAALVSLLDIGRTRPHLYRIMFTTPAGDPTAAVEAAGAHARPVSPSRRPPRWPAAGATHRALLLTAAHGATSFESTSHFVWDKWHTDAEGVIDSLIALLPTEK